MNTITLLNYLISQVREYGNNTMLNINKKDIDHLNNEYTNSDINEKNNVYNR